MTEAPATIETESRDDAGWALILFVLGLLGLLQLGDPFTIAPGSLLTPTLFFGTVSALALFYRRWRPDPALAGMLVALQQMILFTCLGSILSYMLAARAGIYWDAQLQQWDQALGLDWRAYLQFVNDRPVLGTAYWLAYQTLIPQMIVLIVGLGIARRLHALRVTMAAAIIAGVATILISGATPAVANFVFLGLSPADYPNLTPGAAFVHLQDIEAVRAGTLRTLAVDRLQGIITFPSYHAALATVFIWGFWNLPLARWPGIVVAALTILATPIDGGHYFVDVIAGIAIALLALLLATRAVALRLSGLFRIHLRARRAGVTA